MEYLNDAGDKLFSNKEFIMSRVRGEPSPDFILDVGTGWLRKNLFVF